MCEPTGYHGLETFVGVSLLPEKAREEQNGTSLDLLEGSAVILIPRQLDIRVLPSSDFFILIPL